MTLLHLKDKNLLAETKRLVNTEREVTTQVLHHLIEIDRRKLYCELKCTSLFDYCVKELGYSEASAQRRIVAARMLAKIPTIERKIESGHLTLSNISLVNQFIKNPEQQAEVLKEVEGLTRKECEKKLFEITGKEELPGDRKKRVSKDKVQVAIVLTDETMKQIEKLKGLLGKDLSMDDLVLFMATEAIKAVEKTKFKQTEKPRKSLSPAKVGRIISASVKRETYKRDQKCTNCGSTHRLNFDHRHPYALGGLSSIENIRILCFHCNQRARMNAGLNYHTKPRF